MNAAYYRKHRAIVFWFNCRQCGLPLWGEGERLDGYHADCEKVDGMKDRSAYQVKSLRQMARERKAIDLSRYAGTKHVRDV